MCGQTSVSQLYFPSALLRLKWTAVLVLTNLDLDRFDPLWLPVC